MDKKNIIVGRVNQPYGIFGWIHVSSFTEQKKNIFNYFPWVLSVSKYEYQQEDVLYWKKHKKNFIVLFKGIHTRTDAYKISKQNIIVQYTQFPHLKKNEYYWNDILSCQVYNVRSQYLGHIIRIIESNYYDILLVTNKKKEKSNIIHIPFVEPQIIKKIDLIEKKITAQWII